MIERDNRGLKPKKNTPHHQYERERVRLFRRYKKGLITYEEYIREKGEVLIRYHKRMKEGYKGDESQN